jgi:hypothetical protein
LTSPGGTVVDTETETVSGNGTYTTPTGAVPTIIGTYVWTASYSGDTNNQAAVSAPEPVTVTLAPLDVPAGTTVVLTGANVYSIVTVEGVLTVNGSLMASSVALDGSSAMLNGSGSVAAPVVISAAGSGAMISGLTIRAVGGTGVDIQPGANSVTVNGSTMTGSNIGLLIEPGNGNSVSITGGTISGNMQGLVVLNGCVTATGNIIGGTAGQGNNVGVYVPALNPNNSALAVNPLLTLERNQIAGNTVGVDNASTMAVKALFNWWGSPTGPGTTDGSVGVNVNDYTPYALDATSAGPGATGTHFFNGTAADGNVYVTGTLGADILTALVDGSNTNLIHVTLISSSGTSAANYTRNSASNRLIVYSFGSSGAATHDTIQVVGNWDAEIHTGPGNNKVTTLGSGDDVVFGGGNDQIALGNGNNVIVGGLSTGKTGAPTAPQWSVGKGANLFIAGDIDCALAPLAPFGRLDYATLRSMDDVWASGSGGATDAMSAAALFSVVNTPGAILAGTARAVITSGGGKTWYILKGASNPTAAAPDRDYVTGSASSPSYRQAIS